MKYLPKLIIIIFFLLGLTNCSAISKKNTSKTDDDQQIVKKKRINPNIEEKTKDAAEKGGILGGFKRNDNKFIFASSNVLWRATLSSIDFMPLATVDYAGGVILTDWYSSEKSSDQIKIKIQFLSSELSSNSIKIENHKKICRNQSCSIVSGSENLNKKIKEKILLEARNIKIIDEETKKK